MPTVELRGVFRLQQDQGIHDARLHILQTLRLQVDDLVYDVLGGYIKPEHVGFIPVVSALCHNMDDVQYLKIMVPDLFVGSDRLYANRTQELIDRLARALVELVVQKIHPYCEKLRCVDCQVMLQPKGEQDERSRSLIPGHASWSSDITE